MKNFYYKSNSIFFLFLLVISSLSCESLDYEPEGKNYVDIKIKPQNITMTLNYSQPGDTLRLWGNVTLKLDESIYDASFVSSDLFLDTQHINSIGYWSYIDVNTFQLPSGKHNFIVKIIKRSNSGSLADKLKSEYVEKELIWPIIIDNSPLQTPTVLTTITPEGKVKVKWSTYKGLGFSHYYLIRSDSISSQDITINNQNVGEWIDPYFIGGKVSYFFNVYAKNQSTNSRALIDLPGIKLISVEKYLTQSAKVIFSKPKYPANFKGYNVYKNQQYQAYPKIVYTTNNINDTVYTLNNLDFGSITEIWVSAFSTQSEASSLREQYSIGTKHFENISNVFYSKNTNSIYVWNSPISIGNQIPAVFRIDPISLNVLASASKVSNFNISYDGATAIGLEDEAYRAPTTYSQLFTKITILNPLSLVSEKKINISDMLNTPYSSSKGVFLTDGGQIFLPIFNYSTGYDFKGNVIYNINTNANTALDKTAYFLISVSSNRERILDNNGNKWKYNNSSFQSTDFQSGFYFLNDTKIATVDGNILKIFDSQSSILEKEISLPFSAFYPGYSYDEATNRLGISFYNLNMLLIVDLTSNQIVYKLNVSGDCWIANNILFSYNGYALKLE